MGASSLFFDCFFCKTMLVQLFRKEKESIDDLMAQSCCLVVDVCTGGSDDL